MKRGPFTNPFSAETSLEHKAHRHFASEPHSHPHGCNARTEASERDQPCLHEQHVHSERDEDEERALSTPEQLVDRAVESAVVRALFGGNDLARRAFIRGIGSSTFTAALASVFPLAACQRNVKEEIEKTEQGVTAASTANPLEKTDLKIGFVPITCATPAAR